MATIPREIMPAMKMLARFLLLTVAFAPETFTRAEQPLLTGEQAMGDWRTDAPGVRRRITVNDLPPPASNFFAIKPPRVVARPQGAEPRVMLGFKVQLYESGLRDPRFLLTAPNGDIFVSESGANEIKILRDKDQDGRPDLTQVFADANLNRPFGLAFYPPGPDPRFLYIANTDSVVRIPYQNGDIHARGPVETLAPLSRGAGFLGGGGHWTRDIVFSADGKKMYVSIGSYSNNSDNGRENDRARIFALNPDGTSRKVFAWGIRNAVGIVVRPGTDELWMSTNERDEIGDNLPPDYISRVQPRGFYGWPWFYIGNHPDPKHKGKHPELADKVIVPDVLIQPHSASLNLCFYDGNRFPAEYRGDIFAALHGSWNRDLRTGYKIIRVPFDHATGRPLGEYQDFVTGFVTPDGRVWGRPVGITVAKDGALLFSDDGNNTIWRVVHE